MRKIKNLMAIFSLAFGLFIMSACDPCKDVECVHGECEEGDCICNTGYEGVDCATEMRTKFLGTYTITDSCEPQSRNSTITTSTTAVTKVIISNIIDATLGGNAIADIDGNTISIAEQQVVDSQQNSWTVKGLSKGTLSGDSFSLSVRFTYGTNTVDCTLSFSKQ